VFTFIHSADWQLGSRFAQFRERAEFGDALEKLREARMETLRRVVTLAREKSADALLIAGDLFEDQQVPDALVREVWEVFSAAAPLRVFISPGNHDPFTGPGCIWAREPWSRPPENVHVFTASSAMECHGAHLLAAPLRQKRSPQDPTLALTALAASVPTGCIKIGLAHGSPAVPGQHQPDEFPIALDAASRAGLDYLALGHWHGWRDEFDHGRMVMPGTPEPDRFDQPNAGHVALVTIAKPGAAPRIEKIPVASLRWHSSAWDCTDLAAPRAVAEPWLHGLADEASRTVLRLRLTGSAPRESLASFRAWLEDQLPAFAVARIADECSEEFSAAELALLREQHPLIAGLLADLDRLESLALGGKTTPIDSREAQSFTLDDARTLLASAKNDPAKLTPDDFRYARRLALQLLREETA
jgi:hypothetical protein